MDANYPNRSCIVQFRTRLWPTPRANRETQHRPASVHVGAGLLPAGFLVLGSGRRRVWSLGFRVNDNDAARRMAIVQDSFGRAAVKR